MLQTLFSRCNITYFAETKHEEKKIGKVMITDEKKAVPYYPFLFYKAFCNTTEFASGQNKLNPILASSWFPKVVPRQKKSLSTMK